MNFSYKYHIDQERWVQCMHEEFSPLYPKLQEMLREYAPDLIIELGTKYGGMTMVFHEACPGTAIYSYDNRVYDETNDLFAHEQVKLHPEWYPPCVEFRVEDVLTFNQGIVDAITRYTGKVFLYSDNGNKVGEVQSYGPYLKVGDLLGFHDCPGEITPEQVADVLKDFEPHPINEWLIANGCSDRFFVKVHATVI